MLELYHHGSSACAARVRLVLAEKDLDWRGHYIDLMQGEQFAPDYVALNPKAVVPTLVHDGNVITESTVICEYLDDAFPAPNLLPRDPLGRARARLWTKAVDEELHPACSALTYIVSHRHRILKAGVGGFDAFLAKGGTEGRTARERKWRWINDGLEAPGADDQLRIYAGFIDRMDRALEDTPWLAGATVTLADLAMTPYLFRLDSLSLDDVWRRHVRVGDWYRRIRERPSFDAALERWLPDDLRDEMRRNGQTARAEVAAILGL